MMILSSMLLALLTSSVLQWHHDAADVFGWEHVGQRGLVNQETGAVLREHIYHGDPLWDRIRVTHFSRRSRDQSMVSSLWYPHSDYDAPILMIDAATFAPGRSLLFVNVYGGEGGGGGEMDSLHRLLQWHENRDFVEPKTKHLQPMESLLTEGAMIYAHIYDDAKKDRAMALLQKYLDEYVSVFDFTATNKKTKHKNKATKIFNRIRLPIEKDFHLYQDAFDKEAIDAFLEEGFPGPGPGPTK
jgi:hypothetical protein